MISQYSNVRLTIILFAFNHILSEGSAAVITTSPSIVFPSDQEDQTGKCFTSIAFDGGEQTLYCPTLDNTNVRVDIVFEQKVHLVCLTEYDLGTINATVGDVKGFRSDDCNIIEDLSRIFDAWNIRKTQAWYIRGGSKEDLVLRKEHFNGVDVASIRDISIHSSNIVGVAADTFQDFTSLENISLRWNKMQSLPDFWYLKSLVKVDFGGNRISELPQRFANPNLKLLLLWSNEITALNETLFLNTTKLRTLELSKNKIQRLPEQLLKPLSELSKINLSENDFTELPPNLFRNNSDLTEIRLQALNITNIPENIFSGLSKLTTIMLETTLLETLPEGCFADQTNMENVYLSRNRLKNLPDNLFKSFGKVKLLNLSNNQLTKWSKTLSEDLKNLEKLDLSLNKFGRIETGYFTGLRGLKQLDLKRNNISFVDINAFSSFEALDYLDLSYNNLTDGDSATFIDGAKRMKYLTLAHNNYRNIPNSIEAKITKLDMSNNKIGNIDLIQLHTLKSVNLRHNQIDSIDFRAMDIILSTDYFPENLGKVEINLTNNTIDCGCDVFNLIQFFDGTYKRKEIYEVISIEGDLPCRSPANMVGKNVSTLKSQQFTCDYSEIYTCPDECACELYPEYQSFNVSCNNRNLRTPPVIPLFQPVNYGNIPRSTLGMFSIKRLRVDLSNNSIANFTARDKSYVNVTELYLSDNELRAVSWLPEELEILELNDNRLENLDYKTISVLNNSHTLKLLTLHDNRWNCNCELLNFTRLLKSKNLKIPFDERIRCTNGERVLGLVEGDLCGFENQAALVAVGICFSIFLIAICVALILYYKYEYEVKVWLYSKPLLMRFVTEEELDKDKVYDAFLSYSHKDEEFVVKDLLPQLEGGPNPYKLCIHARDWVIGEFITKQIVDSVEQSRRTIIVLSPHFLESEWAQMEFRTAHTQAMNERRNRLIVILYGDVDPNAIEDPELKAYLTTNTYVKWGDPWFWKKLKYVLPHKKGERNNNIDVSNGRKKIKNKRMENIMVTLDKMDLMQTPVTPNLGTPPAVSMDPLLIKGSALALTKVSNATTTPPAESGLITTMTC